MADNVKWIKIKVGLFDGTSFKRIKKAKIGGESFRDKLTAVWFELLDLGAKCNNGGFLYSDEIPYGSEEDIAIMIDRDVDEVNLCLEFYRQNGMIEIINDLYCLSNWSKYQNVEGLEKIREQTRLRVAKHRESQKEKDVTLRNVTSNDSILISNSNTNNNIINNDNSNIYKEEYIELLNYWNSKDIIKHKMSQNIEKEIKKALKDNTIDEIKTYIDRYEKVIKDKNYFFKTHWTLVEFLKQKNAMNDFKDDGSKWINYISQMPDNTLIKSTHKFNTIE